MPRVNIIILDQLTTENTYRYVLWADVPLARQPFYANATATSAWKDALAADVAALQSGAVVEKADTLHIAAGTTIPQVQAFLQQRWTDYQALVTASNPWVRYGTTWNGTAWTAAGVA